MVDPIYSLFTPEEETIIMLALTIIFMLLFYIYEVKPQLKKLKQLEKQNKRKKHLNSNNNGHLYDWAKDEI